MDQLVVSAEPAGNPLRQRVSVRQQTICVEAAGDACAGDQCEETALSPKELVLSGLASCTAMTLASFLERSQLPCTLRRVQVSGEWTSAGLQGLQKTLILDQAVSAEHETVLIRVAKKCPVSQLLQQSVPLAVQVSVEAIAQ